MTDQPRARLFELAAGRHGVVTVDDASKVGVTRSQLRTDVARGWWRRACTGVLVCTAVPHSWLQDLAVAAASTGAVASHRSAARLHGLDGHHADETIELTVLRPTRRERPGWVIHQVAELDRKDCVRVEGIPCTGLARTLVDLGAVVADDLVEQALDDAYRRGVSPRWIDETLARAHRPGPTGTHVLRRLLDRDERRGPLPGSVFERLMERAVVDAGLPRPTRQHRVLHHDGRVIAVLDHAWPDRLVGAEAQSERWHGGPRGAQRDLDRHNRLTALGWRMVYATWDDSRAPAQFVGRLRDLHQLAPPT